jgi:hypothetical protein
MHEDDHEGHSNVVVLLQGGEQRYQSRFAICPPIHADIVIVAEMDTPAMQTRGGGGGVHVDILCRSNDTDFLDRVIPLYVYVRKTCTLCASSLVKTCFLIVVTRCAVLDGRSSLYPPSDQSTPGAIFSIVVRSSNQRGRDSSFARRRTMVEGSKVYVCRPKIMR